MKVFPSSLSELYIEWGIKGDRFTLFRSTSPSGEFEIVATDLLQPFYRDANVNLYDENLRYYYRVEGFLDGEKVGENGPASMEYNRKNAVAHKVIHECRTALRMMNNPPVYFLLKMREGMPCPECWNPITKRSRFAKCDSCAGTGIYSGYHPPIAARISQDVSQLMIASSEMDGDKVKLTPIQAWVDNAPLLYPEDVMVDVLNQRYKIVGVSKRTHAQYIIRQILSLVPLEKGHPAYLLEVDRTVNPQ